MTTIKPSPTNSLPTKEELRTRLLIELSKTKQTEIIDASEFKQLLKQSQFQCPKFKSLKNLCFNPNSCPPRPRPCETCQFWKGYKRVFKAKDSTQPIINEAFTRLQKICEPCELPNRYYDESTYFDECRRAIRARTKLEKKNKGEIKVMQAGTGLVLD